jgi:hypothetical protein
VPIQYKGKHESIRKLLIPLAMESLTEKRQASEASWPSYIQADDLVGPNTSWEYGLNQGEMLQNCNIPQKWQLFSY